MLIPKMLYGTHKDVASRVKKVITRVAAGANISEAVEAEDALDTATVEGDIFLEPPYRGYGDDQSFHPAALGQALSDAYVLKKKFDSAREDVLFDELLSTPWGAVTILGRHNAQDWVTAKQRFASYLKGVLKYRNELDAVGARFVRSAGGASMWWSFPHGVVYCLANLGASVEEIERFNEDGTFPAVAHQFL